MAEKTKGKYTIKFQNVHSGYRGEKRTSGWTQNTSLYFNTPEDCHKVIDLAKLEGWVICYNDGSFDKEVEMSPIITACREAEKAESEKHDQEQEALAKRINAQPTIFKRTYGEGKVITTLILTRSIATYDPKMSRSVRVSVSGEIKGKERSKYFSAELYIARGGAIQKKKFIGDFGYLTLYASLIANDLKSIKEQVEAIKRGEYPKEQ